MDTIIVGSRSIKDPKIIIEAIEKCGWEISSVVVGNSLGVDRVAAAWARNNNIPLTIMPANWSETVPGPGSPRNVAMAKKAQGLLAIWDGKSPGTKQMLRMAKYYKLKRSVCYAKPSIGNIVQEVGDL